MPLHCRSLLLLAGAALLATGCEKTSTVPPGEQVLTVGFLATTACPDQKTHIVTIPMYVTVFAKDGQVVPNIGVTVATDFGTLDASRVTTDTNGRATVTLTTQRPPRDDNKVSITASLDNGTVASASIATPSPPILIVAPSTPTPTVGTAFEVSFYVTGACAIHELDSDLTYDSTALEYLPDDVVFGGILEDTSGDGTAINYTLVNTTPSPGTVHVAFSRSDAVGVSKNGTYLSVKFKPLVAGATTITIPRFQSSLIPSVGPAYVLYSATDETKDRVTHSFTLTVAAASSSR
jgi:hypothetical protein